MGEFLAATIRKLEPRDVPVCARILEEVPEWFGIEEANWAYVDGLSHLPSAVAELGDEVVGFVSIRSHDARSAEIEVMAVLPDRHREGIGRTLVDWAREWCRREGVVWLHVKTRGPSTPDPHYARTRKFYRGMGFEPLFESTTLWGPEDAALILIEKLDGNA